MRSAIFTGKNTKTNKSIIEIKNIPKPVCKDNMLLIKTKATALCTYEQRIYNLIHKVEYPFVGGHEVAGEIVAIGEEIKSDYWKIGDKVVVGVTLPCRNCDNCKSGNEQACKHFNANKLLPGQPCRGPGGLSEYMMQQPECVFKYYNVSPEEACLSEPLSCCIHSVETTDPQFGDNVVIIGAGIMGLLHLQLCTHKGTNTTIVDYNNERLRLAQQLGAKHIINPKNTNIIEQINKITHGKKADIVFDTIPNASVIEKACHYLGNGGKLMIYSGIYPNEKISIDPHWIHKSSIQILGSANSNDRDFIRASSMISNRIIDVTPFINETYSIQNIALAFESAKGKFRNIVLFD